ncbi:hypothetical protein [Tunturiibacter gelidiferens]|uniref:hypothetical protein n=1 Tax=Tunturiibacter gelidiferens TaxID=3069689 RepID=UPI003D9B4B4A
MLSGGTVSTHHTWIDGVNGLRHEPLIYTWDNYKQIVLLPDDAFLMAYQLASRVLADGSISWDIRNVPLRNEAGNIVKWYGTGIEIETVNARRKSARG